MPAPGPIEPPTSMRANDRVDRVAPLVGIGRDEHPFGPGRPLAIGGIEIAAAPRLYGHSDGDVVLHAVADALLGAAGLGDLGRLFPADDRTRRGVASSELLEEVLSRLSAEGLVPVSVDLTIVGARPRLGGHLDAIRTRLAELLDVPAAAVNIKASTGNLIGAEGAGRAISAHAVVVVEHRAR
jgi:2-C-methyl-D-erythritol 2,4-cyclodiphosphate synthase